VILEIPKDIEWKVWRMVSRVYTMGLYNWFRIRNKSKVFFNIQTYKNRILSTKRICIRKSEIKTN